MARAHPEDKVTAMTGTVCSVGLDVTLKPSKRQGADAREGQLAIKVSLAEHT